ncbi:hypothetical protein [Aurantiacibacter poecillastricola]|uniref:hypothetical protein n=1 Tax=Aurantiacibacter poecillastricola TaxID=3064385 RepID=UPI00273CFC54|nr:hypothetical protein [Aurantiacibacter sp. 219JJ12-13]MDP5261491.1 hypothetical protein [Aurantiacibacter sp. 219JJ12-13]
MLQPVRSLFLVLTLSLGACASAGEDYPSLALRELERESGTMAVEPAPPPPPTAPSTLGELDDLAAAAREAHADFLAALPRARSLTSGAAGAPRGSEAWSRAQVGIAELESQRSEAMIALADLDRIYVDAATSALSTEGIASVRSEIDALVDEQDAAISQLLAQLTG